MGRRSWRAGVARAVGLVVLAGAGVVAPVATLPAPAARPVPPHVHQVHVSGRIDDAALRDASALDTALGHAPGTGVVRPRVRSSSDALERTVTGRTDGAPGPGAAETSADEGELAVLGTKTLTVPFLVAGVTWAPGRAVVLEADARVLEDGAWSSWFTLDVDDLGLPGERPGTAPIVTGGADGVQVRLLTVDGSAPADVRVDVVDPGTSPADATVGEGLAPAPAASAQASTGDEIRPTIVTRAQWGADESRGSAWPQVSAKLQAMYVHHTAGTNGYSRSQSAAIVRGIYAFHTGSRGWPDIGYQFLVDKYGTVYQGRRDAIDDNPVGAQAGGYNTGTIGVSAIGNYDTVKPSAALLTGIERVLAWKAYRYGLNPTGRTTLLTGSSTGSRPRHKAGTRVSEPVILGHRDTNGTACPGRYLYAKLPTIRAAVASRVAAAKHTYGTVRYTTAPPSVVAATANQKPVQWSATTTYSWKPVAGAVRYQVLTRAASRGNRTDLTDTRYWTVSKTVTGTSATVSTAEGATRLVAVRAVDAAGRLGPVRSHTQATRPVPSSAVGRSASWTRTSDAALYGGAGWRATASTAQLTVTGLVDVRQVVVRGATGPGTGPLEVRAGDARLGVLDPTTLPASSDMVMVLPLARAVSGTLRLVALDGGRKVVSALAFPRVAATRPVGVSATRPPAAPAAAAVTSAARVSLGASTTFRWQPSAGATRYEVWTRTGARGRPMSTTWTYHGAQSGTSVRVATRSAGTTYQVRVRAVGRGGSGATRTLGSVTTPLAWSQVSRSSGWTLYRSPSYLRGVAYGTSRAGRTLRVVGRAGPTLRVYLRTAPGQGRLQVAYGGRTVVVRSTASSGTVFRAWFDVTSARSGTIEVRTLDGRPVRVSALAVLRS